MARNDWRNYTYFYVSCSNEKLSLEFLVDFELIVFGSDASSKRWIQKAISKYKPAFIGTLANQLNYTFIYDPAVNVQ